MLERMVSIEELDEGMLITADVYTRGGIIIVPENTVVTTEVLNLLAKHSIMEVIVGEEGADTGFDFSADELGILDDALGMLDYLEQRENRQETFEETVSTARVNLEQCFDKIVKQESVDISQLHNIVNTIVGKADNDVNLLDMLYKMNREESDLYLHSLKVSMYSRLLAKWKDLPEEEVELAGLAGLLHDIGLIVCHKEGEKNITLHGEYENKCGTNHMLHSYNLMKDWAVDMRVKQAVLTHHERMDLSGFPKKLSYKSLNDISRVVAIADAYDTLNMLEEGFESMQPLTALNYMFDNCYIKFDTEMLICFIEHMVQNFIQYEVALSNGQRGKIVMANRKEPARPLVMVDGGFVDLSQRKDITITEMIY